MSGGGLFDPMSLRLVGRDREIAACRDAVDADVGCLAIIGESLVGTTRLAVEVVDVCRDLGMRVRWAEPVLGVGVTVGEADDVPTVVFVGDSASDVQLQAWARAYRGTGSIVVATASSSPAVPTVALGPLSDHDVRDLAGQVDTGLADETVERIVELSDGLPGAAIEMALAPPVFGQPLPERLQRLLDKRCGWLRTEPKLLDLAKVAARMGLFDLEGLSNVLNAPPNEVEPGLRSLKRHGLICVRDALSGVLTFTHDLTRFVLVDPAPDAPWTIVGSESTSFSEQELHALLSANVRLAEQAIERRDWALAGSLCEPWVPAVDAIGDPGLVGAFFAVFGHSLEGLVRLPESQESFDRAAASYADAGSAFEEDRCRHHAGKVGVRIHSRRLSEQARDQTESSVAKPGEDLVVETYRSASDHRWPDVQRLAASALGSTTQLDADGSDRLRLAALKAEADLNVDLRVAAIDDLEQILDGAIECDVSVVVAEVVSALVVYFAEWRGDLDAARRIACRGLAAVEDSKDALRAAVVRSVLCLSLADSGQLDELAAHVQATHGENWDLGGRRDLSTVRMSLARGVGDFDAVVQVGGRELADSMRWDLAIQIVCECLGAAVHLNRLDLTRHPSVLELAGLPQLKDGCVMNRLHLFVAFAEARVPGAESWADLLGNGRYPLSRRGEAMRLMAAGFESDLAADRFESFAAAAGLFEELGIVWWHARALLAAGESADNSTALGLLERGHQVFDAIGATGWTKRCQEAMRERGVRWRRSAPPVGGLSARELEIVDLVCEGLTNAQIARHLVLSENTVARHLTRIFRKVGVRSRRELAGPTKALDSQPGV